MEKCKYGIYKLNPKLAFASQIQHLIANGHLMIEK